MSQRISAIRPANIIVAGAAHQPSTHPQAAAKLLKGADPVRLARLTQWVLTQRALWEPLCDSLGLSAGDKQWVPTAIEATVAGTSTTALYVSVGVRLRRFGSSDLRGPTKRSVIRLEQGDIDKLVNAFAFIQALQRGRPHHTS